MDGVLYSWCHLWTRDPSLWTQLNCFCTVRYVCVRGRGESADSVKVYVRIFFSPIAITHCTTGTTSQHAASASLCLVLLAACGCVCAAQCVQLLPLSVCCLAVSVMYIVRIVYSNTENLTIPLMFCVSNTLSICMWATSGLPHWVWKLLRMYVPQTYTSYACALSTGMITFFMDSV